MTPQVAVVMPVRSGARWLGEAVESADRTRARRTRRLFFGLLRQRPGMIPLAAWRALPAVFLR